jgi:hypothetical protein
VLPYAFAHGVPKNLIQQGETVALDLRPHWWYFSQHLHRIPLASW